MSVCLAVICHDPSGSFAKGVGDSGATLAKVFGSIAVNATAETAHSTMSALQATSPTLTRRTHGAGTVGIGTARRDALALALETPSVESRTGSEPLKVWSTMPPAWRWERLSPAARPGTS